MFALRFVLLLVAVAAYVATSVGLCVRATDHVHDAPKRIEQPGPTSPKVTPQRKGAEEYIPGPVPLTKKELADLRATLRDQSPGLGK